MMERSGERGEYLTRLKLRLMLYNTTIYNYTIVAYIHAHISINETIVLVKLQNNGTRHNSTTQESAEAA